MILIDLDLADDQLQVVSLQLLLFQDVPEHIHGGFRRPVHPNVVGSAARASPAVVGAAGIGRLHIAAAGGKHGAAAVPALHEAGVDVVVLFHAPVVGGGSLFPERPGNGEGAVVDDGLVMIFDDDMLGLVLTLFLRHPGVSEYPAPSGSWRSVCSPIQLQKELGKNM